MPANKISSYIVHYRSRKKEEAELERQRKLEDRERAPKIIDPSFELFGRQMPEDHVYEDSFGHNLNKSPATSPGEDWTFQNRRAATMPHPYQLEPYCEVTPKSSVSSSNSACSDLKPVTNYDMGWDTTNAARPRPQSYLPPIGSASQSLSMSDLHRSSVYRSARRQSSHHETTSSQKSNDEHIRPSQPSYKMGASLFRPFSIDDPLEALSEMVADGQEDQAEEEADESTREASSHISHQHGRSLTPLHDRNNAASPSR